MKEGSRYRINFLNQGARGFTYRGMIYGIVAWTMFLALLFGLQMLRTLSLEKEIDVGKQRLTFLNAEKEREIALVRAVGRKKAGVSAKQDLLSIIASRPRWAGMLRALSLSLPPDVWLDSVNVEPVGEWYSVKVAGKAKTQKDLTSFILKLEESGFFSKTALNKTGALDAEADAFDFYVTTEPVSQRLLTDDQVQGD